MKPEIEWKPIETRYKIVSGSPSYCEDRLNELSQDFHLSILQAFLGKPRPGYPDYIFIVLALVPREKVSYGKKS